MYYLIKGPFSFSFWKRKSLGLKFNCYIYSLWGSWMGLDPFHILVLLEWHPFPTPSPYSWLFINLLPNAPIINSLMYIYICVCVCVDLAINLSSLQLMCFSLSARKILLCFHPQKNWENFGWFFLYCKFDWIF